MRDFFTNYTQRTDLAKEIYENHYKNNSENLSGVTSENRKIYGFDVNVVEIKTPMGEKLFGKPMGKYFTVDVGKIWLSDKTAFVNACKAIAECVKMLIPDKGSCLLAALGNRAVTADAIGPVTGDNFIVTRHIKTSDISMFEGLGMRETLCVYPGVSGSTGMEAAEIVKGAVESASPAFVIAVDALASSKLSRLATHVQICNTGISPGSGINNTRKEISKATLGIPVIAVGVPTVVEVTTLAIDILTDISEKVSGLDKSTVDTIMQKASDGNSKGYFVTPKETDHIIKDISKLIGYGLNLALHEGISVDEIDEFVS